jgi:hypothetical protein
LLSFFAPSLLRCSKEGAKKTKKSSEAKQGGSELEIEDFCAKLSFFAKRSFFAASQQKRQTNEVY